MALVRPSAISKFIDAEMNAVELVSPMPLAECRRLLRAETDGPIKIFGNRPLVGLLFGEHLSVRKRVGYRNPLQTVLWASLTEQSGQTCVHCRFHIHPVAIVFFGFWFCPLLYQLFSQPSHAESSPAYVSLITMIFIGIGLVWFGLYLARDERQFLIGLVSRTLAAEDCANKQS